MLVIKYTIQDTAVVLLYCILAGVRVAALWRLELEGEGTEHGTGLRLGHGRRMVLLGRSGGGGLERACCHIRRRGALLLGRERGGVGDSWCGL